MFTGSDTLPDNSGRKVVAASLLAALCAGALILFLFDPSRVAIYPVCLFHRVTGLDCPGCGGLRATHALLHGDVLAALRFNAMVVFSVPLFAALGGWFLLRKSQGKPAQLRQNLIWIYFAVWITFSVLRDLPIPFFAGLAP